MKRLIIALLTLVCGAAYAGPLYVPATNGSAWASTPGGSAINIKSNMQMGVEGTISWAESLASVRVDHDIHGAGIDLLVMAGGPDVAITPGAYGGSLQFGGIAEIGNHSLWGTRAQLNYAGGATAGLPGHSTPLDFEALYGDAPVYSKFSLVGRPGTNVVSDGWANGYLEGWDVPPLWNNTTFSVLPNLQSGRRLFKWGREGLFLDAGGFQGMAFTNTGSAGTLLHEWVATNGIPGEVAADGSIATSAADNGSVYIRNNGAWLRLSSTMNNFSTNLVAWRDFNAGLVSPALGVSGAGAGYVANLFVITNRTLQANVFSIGDGGDTTIGGALALGTTPSTYLTIQNTTAAAAGAQQVSPSILLSGQGWKTTATAASQQVDFRQYVLPVQGSAAPSATWTLQSQINGGGFTDRLTVGSAGNVDITGGSYGVYNSSDLRVQQTTVGTRYATAAFIDWRNNANISAGTAVLILSKPSDGVLSVDTTAAGNAGGKVSAAGYFEGVTTTATGITLGVTHGLVIITGASQTITLPTAVGIGGRKYTVKATDATGATIATTSGQTIDGTTPVALALNESRTYQSDGANWWIVSAYNP